MEDDFAGGDVECLGCDAAPDRLVTLAGSGRPDPGHDRARSVDLDTAVFPRVGLASGALDERPDADPEWSVSPPAALRLLSPHLVVAHCVERSLECCAVVPGIELRPGGRLVRQAGDHVAASNLGRIDTELGSQGVHGSLDGERRLGSPGATVRSRRGLIRDGRHDLEVDPWNVVQTRRHESGEDGDHDAAMGVGPGARQQAEPGTVNSTVGVGVQRHLVPLRSPM